MTGRWTKSNWLCLVVGRGLLCATVALAVVLGAGCGGSSSSPEQQAGGGTGAQQTGGSTQTENEQVTLEVWDWGAPPPEATEALDQAFMAAHPNITIKRVHQPFENYFTLQRAAVTAKKGPDVMEGYASPFIFDFYDGLLPLTDLVTQEDRENLTGWNIVSADLSDEGTPYAVPWTSQAIHFYYNKALFEQAGLDPDAPPQTWDELLAACEALKNAGIVPIVAGFKDGYYAEWFIDLLASQFIDDGELPDLYRNMNWLHPGVIQGWNAMLELYNKGYMTPSAESIPLFPDTVNNFAAEKGAMFVGLSASDANWAAFSDDPVGKHLGAFLAPVLPGAVYTTPRYDFAPGLSWTIMKWTEHPQEAYEFISFLANAQSQETAFKLAGSIPNNKQSAPQTDDPVAEQILGWVQDAPKFMGPIAQPIRATVEVVYDKVVPQIVTGQLSVEEGMTQVQAEQDKTPAVPSE